MEQPTVDTDFYTAVIKLPDGREEKIAVIELLQLGATIAGGRITAVQLGDAISDIEILENAQPNDTNTEADSVPVDINDPCACGVKDSDGLIVNYDPAWGDAHVIHNPDKGGCGKFMRHWSRD